MPPTATTRSEWAGFHKMCPLSQITTDPERPLYARQNSQIIQVPSPTEPPFKNTLLPPPSQSSGPPGPGFGKPHIIGLPRSIFIVVIVVGVVVLTVIGFVSVCCYRRWKMNRPVREHRLSVQMQDIDHRSNFGDPPRPDSTTPPMQNALQSKLDDTLPHADGNAGSPLGTMLNRFNSPSGSASHRRLGSADSTYSSRVTWDNNHIARTVSHTMPPSLCGPTSSTYRGVSVSSYPSTPGPLSPAPFSAYRSPSITSLESNPLWVSSSTRSGGKRPLRDTIMSVPRPLLISKRSRKKARPVAAEKLVSEPGLGTPAATSAGFGRASAGSMSNWVSWWESSSDEEEEKEAAKRRKKRKT